MGLCHGHDRKAKGSKQKKSGPFDANQLKYDLLMEINAIREVHQVEPLGLAKEIDSISQSFANKVAKKGDLSYSNNTFRGEELGEILFYYGGDCDAETVIESWNQDAKHFKYNNKNQGASSFAQLVWKSSKYIGIGIAKDNKGGTYIVSNFYPAGNVAGKFKENVFPPHAKSTRQKKDKEPKASKNDTSYKGYSSSSSSTTVNLSEFEKEALKCHNYYRAKHHAPPLTINRDLTKIAQRYAQYLLDTRTFQHSGDTFNGKPMGENLYYCTGKVGTGELASYEWYNEIELHRWKEFQKETGHFTQLIWKGTKEVGFGVANKGNTYFVVANYFPAGNVKGQFKENVLRA